MRCLNSNQFTSSQPQKQFSSKNLQIWFCLQEPGSPISLRLSASRVAELLTGLLLERLSSAASFQGATRIQPECRSCLFLPFLPDVTDGVVDVIVYPGTVDKSRNRGFAFVEYESHKAAAMARRTLIPGKMLQSVPVCVQQREAELCKNRMLKKVSHGVESV
ncbi:hypothetical protein GOODEAATRI_008872 [Goodea atripinnis]|uniref:RRM domain-containing protein n=1 Tax=Goodea atripinnis TaxID=208336 RepID=A0ABV0NA23_9TELE